LCSFADSLTLAMVTKTQNVGVIGYGYVSHSLEILYIY